ncbi:MAG: hypothetical protein AB8F74_15840, partial [Saprospiraceae bacterium]
MKNLTRLFLLTLLLAIAFFAGTSWTQSQRGPQSSDNNTITSSTEEETKAIPVAKKTASKLNSSEIVTIALFEAATPSV